MGLKTSISSFILVALGRLVLSPSRVLAKDKEDEAKAWLASYTAPAQINVDGVWESDDWGTLILHQVKDAREVTGAGASVAKVEGVVSGNVLYLAFVWPDAHGNLSKIYTANLTLGEDGNLRGHYARGIYPPDKEDLSIFFEKRVTAPPVSAGVELGSASAGSSHVVVYRDHYHNCPQFKARVYADGKEAADLQNGRYLTLNLPPGKHLIGTSEIGYMGSQAIELDLAPDKTYYVHFDFPSVVVCTIDVNQATATEAMHVIAKTKPSDAKRVKMPEIVSLAPIEPARK